MPCLIIQNGTDRGKRHPILNGRATMGRSVSNDIQIVDRRMSRNHAEVFAKDNGLYARDLGSKNGTLVNGAPVKLPVRVYPGDVLQVGDTKLLLADDEDSRPGTVETESDSDAPPSDTTSQIHIVDEHQWGATRGEVRAGVTITPAKGLHLGEVAIKDSHRRLEIIYQVSEAIRSILSVDELLEKIMDIVQEVFEPDNAYLLLRRAGGTEVEPAFVKSSHEDITGEIKLSRSIVTRCMEERVAVLVSDAAADDRFSASESIIVNRIRTAMAAPLIYQDSALGVIYVDTRNRMVPYQNEELELLTGLTNQAALAITNARLHSQIVEQHKLAREMEIARTIQMNLLPKVYPTLVGHDISALSLPAKQVGGDYYDFTEMPDGRVALAVADVSGKGVPAAILTATTRSYLQSETQHPGLAVHEIVSRINRMVHRDVTDDMYVTMVLCVLDPRAGAIEYVNAGHAHPVLVRRDGTIERLEAGGLFLGIVEDAEYVSASVALDPEDVLVLGTDGVTDILDPGGEPFGEDRALEIIRENRHRRAEDIRNAIYDACQEHRGDADQFDDFTLIVLRRLPAQDSSLDDLDFE